MKHVMIDLETMGDTPTSAIIAIGAVSFGQNKDKVWVVDESQQFYVKIQLQSCIDAGLSVDGSTVAWWLQQSQAAREEFKNNEKHHPIDFVLMEFATWFKSIGGIYPWGNGADFDVAIMNHAYSKMRLYAYKGTRRQEFMDLQAPWQFWNSRCFRTLKNVIKVPVTGFEGAAHNAGADALHQAKHACLILNNMVGDQNADN